MPTSVLINNDYDQLALTSGDILSAYNRIRPYVHRTPVLQSTTIDQLVGKQLYFKSEHLQLTGSFKSRGALNAVIRFKESNDKDGVITFSAGNHGQGIAYAARTVGIPSCTVVYPEKATKLKLLAMEAYGASLVRCRPTLVDIRETCQRVAEQHHLTYIDPYNNYDVMAGQGTVAVELMEQVENLDAVLVPIGGGGLAAGVATWVNYVNPKCRVFCVEPAGKELQQSLLAGRPMWTDMELLDTLADGARVKSVGDKCFPIIHRYCQHTVLSVTDAEIGPAMRLLWSRLKQTIEPTSAMCFAAIMSSSNRQLFAPYQRIGIILSGGNVNLDHLA